VKKLHPDYSNFRKNGTDDKTWSVTFFGEGSIDAGGPYRESLTNLCNELESEVLPLLIKTPNNRNNHGQNRDCFILNPSANSPTHLDMFKFMGCLIGYAIRTLSAIPFHFPSLFWK
jgi:E3 ubiquitin-protein ligase HERC2